MCRTSHRSCVEPPPVISCRSLSAALPISLFPPHAFPCLQIPTFHARPLHPECDVWCDFPVADRPNAVAQWISAVQNDPSMLKVWGHRGVEAGTRRKERAGYGSERNWRRRTSHHKHLLQRIVVQVRVHQWNRRVVRRSC